MLPHPSNVRSRYVKPVQPQAMAGLETAVQDSALRFKRLPTRIKICFGFSLIGSLVFYGLLFRAIFSNHLTDDNYLETDKCPACFGMSACTSLYYGRVTMKGVSKIRWLDFTNVKNVHFAHHEDYDHGVVVKKLGHNWQLKAVDDKICSDGNRLSGCDVARVIYITNTANTMKSGAVEPKLLKQSTGMFTCASYRLMDRLWMYYQERFRKDEEIFFRDKIQLWYISMINSEPLIIQTFPASEGWPFPQYHGACGRHIVVEDCGRPLSEYFYEPFEKRADIAYQIMKIAEKFTENEERFALYWTDLSFENLAVDASGKVTVIDPENIIVVDLLAVEAVKKKGWDDFEESPFDECNGKNCLSFSTETLCSKVNADHNYYAACRNLLSRYATEGDLVGGLLHDMPEHAREYWDLENLLNECARPHQPQGRFKVKNTLISALDNLRKAGTDFNINVMDDALKNKDLPKYSNKLKAKRHEE